MVVFLELPVFDFLLRMPNHINTQRLLSEYNKRLR